MRKELGRSVASACAVATSLVLVACSSEDSQPPAASAADPATLAADAFIWGYPLVVTQRTMQGLAAFIGVNKLFNASQLSNTSTPHFIVSPNQDTLYSVAVLDLRSEPMVLSVPDVTDRYWTYQFLDAWTNSFAYIGTRATNGKGGTFVVTPPNYTGQIPPGATRISSPTPTLFLLGRYLVRDAADAANVVALNRTLTPLHVVAGTAAPAPSPSLGTAPGSAQDVGKNGAAFFDELGDALGVDPPSSDFDRRELANFRSIGIGPNLHPAAGRDGASVSDLEKGVTTGTQRLNDAITTTGTLVNGWTVHLDIGVYGDNPLLRAAVAQSAWGANVPEESVYPYSAADPAGTPYTGSKRYVVHFDANALPPVDATNGFWSLTLYGTDHFFVENSIKRYAIGDRTPGLAHNPDGSLDIFVQSDQPPALGNWLPAPAASTTAGADAFILILRLYLPQKPVLDGSYQYPPVAPQ